MSDEVINTLCAHFKQDLDKVISDLHLDEIARTRCTYWKSLPSRLGLPDIVAKDIDIKGSLLESEKRSEFFRQWKQRKGLEATYRVLVKALLDIDQRLDAEYVCELLRQAGTISSKASSGMKINIQQCRKVMKSGGGGGGGNIFDYNLGGSGGMPPRNYFGVFVL